eukprot:426637_1
MDNNKFNGPFCICSSRLPLWKQLEQYVNSPNDIALINCQQQFPELTSWFLEIVEGFSWTLLVETANKFCKNISPASSQSEPSMNNELFNRHNLTKCLFQTSTTIHRCFNGSIKTTPPLISSLADSDTCIVFPGITDPKMSILRKTVKKTKPIVRKQNNKKYCKNKDCNFGEVMTELNEKVDTYVPKTNQKKRTKDDMTGNNMNNPRGSKRSKKSSNTNNIIINKDSNNDELDYRNVIENDSMTEYSESEYDYNDDIDEDEDDIDMKVQQRSLMHINPIDKTEAEKKAFIADVSSATEDSEYETRNRQGQNYSNNNNISANPFIMEYSSVDEGAYGYMYNAKLRNRKDAPQ